MADHKSSGAGTSPSVQPVYLTMAAPPPEGIDIWDLWRALLESKWFVVAITFIFALAGVVYSLVITPVYRAEVILAPTSTEGMTGAPLGLTGLASLAGLNVGPGSDSVQAIALLESKNFIAEFIRDRELLPVLFADEWDAASGKWKMADPTEQPDIRDGVDMFAENVRSVSVDSATGLITLGVEWSDPNLATEWATDLVARINRITRERDMQESERKLKYLHDELSKARLVELREAISRVIEEQINAMMLAQAKTEEYAFKVIDPAVVPKKRVRPKRTLIVAVATFLGGVVGVFVVLVRTAIRRDMQQRSSDLAPE